MKRWIFLTIVFLAFSPLQAQQTLKGRVVEQMPREEKEGHDHAKLAPLPGVNLFWLGTTIGTSTDQDGYFELKKPDEAENLVVKYVGYRSDTLLIKNQQEIEILLKDLNTLEGITITFREKSISLDPMNPLNAHTMNEDELYKAACCNLSESFETNPSIDVSYSDGVTGSKQIEMLGLAGIYSQITVENMPIIRGLATIEGLTYIPGTWMNSIQVTKGAGSVVNGYESITGQINAELRKPTDKEKLFANIYLNESGRTELNLNLASKVNENVYTSLLLHSAVRPFAIDRNEDTFLDNPTGENLMLMNRWRFQGKSGWEGQFGFKALRFNNDAGQLQDIADETSDQLYRVSMQTDRLEIWGKAGYVFPGRPYQSLGLQVSSSVHDHQTNFGLNRYQGAENSLYANLIFQSIIGNTAHQYKAGLSFMADNYDESLNATSYDRTEKVPGAFVEYTNQSSEKMTMVAGLRADYHNLYGLFFSPRLHTRLALSDQTTLRASAGRGLRVANILSENLGLLISARTPTIYSTNSTGAYGLNPEIAWNSGLNLTHEFTLNFRTGSVALDFYRTWFSDQVVVDRETTADQVLFYNLEGTSFSNSLQAEVNYELLKFLDLRAAYRWYDVQTTYQEKTLSRPLMANHRAFMNLAYEGLKSWNFDYTLQWIGAKRLPAAGVDFTNFSPDFTLMNAQVTKTFGNLDVYLGMENILDFRQNNPIQGAEDPFGANFESANVWGPIFGRMTYLGARFKML